MASTQRLSLAAAILINLNIMLGSGIFINVILLSQQTDALSPLAYPLVGLIIFPLIAAFSILMAQIPGGTFYEIGSTIHPLAGFVSSWGYFIGKLASAALSMHISITTIQQLIPSLQAVSPFFLDTIMLFVFILLTIFNIKTGRPVQYFFFSLKAMALAIGIGIGFAYFMPVHFLYATYPWAQLPSTVPFILFAFAGFEASCSLSKSIENPEKNGPRAIIFSYAIVLIIVTLYQFAFYGALGPMLKDLATFREPFIALLSRMQMAYPTLSTLLLGGALAGIATSALGASYGILYSNIWNLQTLASYNTLPFSKQLAQLNRFYAPVACIFVAAFCMISYIVGARGNVVPLQLISASANTLSYSISIIALLLLCFGTLKKYRFIALLSVGSCLLLIISTLFNAYAYGTMPYLIYGVLIMIGLIAHLVYRKKHLTHAALFLLIASHSIYSSNENLQPQSITLPSFAEFLKSLNTGSQLNTGMQPNQNLHSETERIDSYLTKRKRDENKNEENKLKQNIKKSKTVPTQNKNSVESSSSSKFSLSDTSSIKTSNFQYSEKNTPEYWTPEKWKACYKKGIIIRKLFKTAQSESFLTRFRKMLFENINVAGFLANFFLLGKPDVDAPIKKALKKNNMVKIKFILDIVLEKAECSVRNIQRRIYLQVVENLTDIPSVISNNNKQILQTISQKISSTLKTRGFHGIYQELKPMLNWHTPTP